MILRSYRPKLDRLFVAFFALFVALAIFGGLLYLLLPSPCSFSQDTARGGRDLDGRSSPRSRFNFGPHSRVVKLQHHHAFFIDGGDFSLTRLRIRRVGLETHFGASFLSSVGVQFGPLSHMRNCRGFIVVSIDDDAH